LNVINIDGILESNNFIDKLNYQSKNYKAFHSWDYPSENQLGRAGIIGEKLFDEKNSGNVHFELFRKVP
jgi:hypothetical protein